MIEPFYLITGGAFATGATATIVYETIKYFNSPDRKYKKAIKRNKEIFDLITDEDYERIANNFRERTQQEKGLISKLG